MNVNPAPADEIYARMLRYRFRADAPARARHAASSLRREGDIEGAKVWLKLAELAEDLPLPEDDTPRLHRVWRPR